MSRLGFGFGFGLIQKIISGDRPSSEPNPIAKYVSNTLNFLFSTDNQIQTWGDEQGANDLTQGTSANQPVLVETDVVKQSTLANMPTLLYDEEVTQDTASNQPTLVDTGGGVLAMQFDGGDFYTGGIPTYTGACAYEIELQQDTENQRQRIFDYSGTLGSNFYIESASTADQYIVRFSDGGTRVLNSTFAVTKADKNTLLFNFTGTVIELVVNGVLAYTVADSRTPTLNNLGGTSNRIEGKVTKVKTWGTALSDPTNIVETPDFELTADPTTMRKTDGTQPVAGDSVQGWWATDAELAVDFDANDYMDASFSHEGEWSFEIETKDRDTASTQRFITRDDFSPYIDIPSSGTLTVRSDDATTFTLTGVSIGANTTIRIKKEGNIITAYDGTSTDSVDVTGYTFNDSFAHIGRSSQSYIGSIASFNYYAFSVSDLTNITETPDFELLPQTQYLRNDSNATASAGDSISAWLSTTHNANDNVVRFDATDDNMTPLPTTTGDFAMQFKKKANTLATTKVLFSSSTTSAEVRLNTSNQFEVVSDAGTVYTFPITFADTAQEVNIVRREGDYIYVHGADSYAELAYVAGETFTFDRISDTANASDSDWQEIRIYDNGLTADEINYFYYLRNENNEILEPPLLPDAGNEFIFSVKTDNAGGVSNNDQMTIGTISTGVYDCTVDWGDGSSDVITTWDDPAWTHTYSVAGTYVITISGTSFTYPYFYLGDDTKVLNVSKWGLTDYGTSSRDSFKGCSNLTLSASDAPDTSSVTAINSAWLNCSSLTSFPSIDTSSVTNMYASWFGCSSLTSFPSIDTSLATNINSSWFGCSSLTSFPLIDTGLATNMSEAWRTCTSLTSFPLIDTSSVTIMSNTWFGCSSLTSFPLINTSSVTTINGAWQSCTSLTSFPLINTSSVTAINGAWNGCSSLTSFPLLDVSSCTNFTNTWKGCALNSDSIDNIMQALVNGNKNNLSTNISGGTNLGFSSWSAGAVANYNTLISRGWTITTNP